MNTLGAAKLSCSFIHFIRLNTASRPICTPLGAPVVPEVNMM